jgi:branched-chain amino acid transport system ATP-binding protein
MTVDRPLRGDAVVATQALAVGYSGVPVARDLDIEVRRGEVVALLGRNGAGKTTTLHTIAGLLPRVSGGLFLHGKTPPRSFHQRARAGLALVPEERAVVRRLTVLENIKVSRASADGVFELFPELLPLRHQRVGMLSGGEQQMLALGKFMAAQPSVLLIDELSLGLAPLVVERLLESVRDAAGQGTGVLLVEQQPGTALMVADRGYVLSGGRIQLAASSDEMLAHLADIEAMYLDDSALTDDDGKTASKGENA